MLAIRPRPEAQRPSEEDYEALATLCRTLFTQRRKQIGAVLGRDRAFPDGIDAHLRPEQLAVKDLVRLANWHNER